jgi:hypothetical protein
MVLLLAFVVVAAASPWFSDPKCLYQEDSKNVPIANPLDLQLTESTIGQLSSDVIPTFGDVLIVDEHEVYCLANVMKQSYLSPCSHKESTGLPETRGSFCEEGGIECVPFQLPHIRLGEPPGHILAIEHQFNQRERVSENDLGHPQTSILISRDDNAKQRCAMTYTKMESVLYEHSANFHTNKNKEDVPLFYTQSSLSPSTQLALRQAQGCESQAYAAASRADLNFFRGGKTACSPGDLEQYLEKFGD